MNKYVFDEIRECLEARKKVQRVGHEVFTDVHRVKKWRQYRQRAVIVAQLADKKAVKSLA